MYAVAFRDLLYSIIHDFLHYSSPNVPPVHSLKSVKPQLFGDFGQDLLIIHLIGNGPVVKLPRLRITSSIGSCIIFWSLNSH